MSGKGNKKFRVGVWDERKNFLPYLRQKVKGKYSYAIGRTLKKKRLKESHRLLSKIFNKKITFALRNKKKRKKCFRE